MNQTLAIIGASMHAGQNKLGVDLGPDAIRYAGLHHMLHSHSIPFKDEGNICLHTHHNQVNVKNQMKNVDEVVQLNEQLSKKMEQIIKNNFFPLILGGDHSIILGSIGTLANQYNNLGIIWFDAHGDMNTNETSPSGHIHGMTLAACLGYGHPLLTNVVKKYIRPENIVMIGVRDLDIGEQKLMNHLHIKTYSTQHIREHGIGTVMEEAVNYLHQQTDHVHLSFDLDVIDPQYISGIGTPVHNGLTIEESLTALQILQNSKLVSSAEFVEVNPLLDCYNRTGKTTVRLLETLFAGVR